MDLTNRKRSQIIVCVILDIKTTDHQRYFFKTENFD